MRFVQTCSLRKNSVGLDFVKSTGGECPQHEPESEFTKESELDIGLRKLMGWKLIENK